MASIDVYLYSGEAAANDTKLSDPTVLRGGGVIHSGAAALSGDGTIAVIGIRGLLAASALSGNGTLAAISIRGLLAASVLSGSGTLAAIGIRGLKAASALFGNGTLEASGTTIVAGEIRRGELALFGGGGMIATATKTFHVRVV